MRKSNSLSLTTFIGLSILTSGFRTGYPPGGGGLGGGGLGGGGLGGGGFGAIATQ